MNQKIVTTLLSVFCLVSVAILAEVAEGAQLSTRRVDTGRSKGRWKRIHENVGRNTEFSKCSSRNVAENPLYFEGCLLQHKYMRPFVKKVGRSNQWNEEMIFVWDGDSPRTVNIEDRRVKDALMKDWSSFYERYRKTQLNRQTALRVLMKADPSREELIAFRDRDMELETELKVIKLEWRNFKERNNLRINATVPTRPNPLSTLFTQTQYRGKPKTRSVKMVSDTFYEAVRKVLDENPNAHLAFLKYHIAQVPVSFEDRSLESYNHYVANKALRMTLECAEGGVKAAVYGIAAEAAPPLYVPLLRACEFPTSRLAKPSPKGASNNSGGLI